MIVESENQQKIAQIIEKCENTPFFSLTISEVEILIKAWIRQVLEQNQPKSDERTSLLTRAEVCKILHISYPTILSYEKRGLLIGKRVGHRVLYEYTTVQESLHKINNVEALPGTPTPSRSD
jgi:hypothetical protein